MTTVARSAPADLGQVQAHCVRVGVRQHQGRADATVRAHGPEQIGRLAALVARGTGPAALVSPHVAERALLADAGLVLVPDLDGCFCIPHGPGQGCGHKGAEPGPKDPCAATFASGWRGSVDTQANGSRCSSLPTLRSCKATPHSRAIRAWMSMRRQRTTPSASTSGTRGRSAMPAASPSAAQPAPRPWPTG